MSTSWQDLAACLRAELADYGALLHLFEAQQRSLFAREAENVLDLARAIETQAAALADARSARERAVAAFAVAHGQSASSTLRSLLPAIEADARPLLEALIDEVNRLLHRLRRTSRQNHSLLAHVVHTQQELLQQLRPQAFTKTYSPSGRVAVAGAAAASTLRASG